MGEINWTDFEKVELRAGTVVEVREFPETSFVQGLFSALT